MGYVGLYNQPCRKPVAFCLSKKVYLSEEDIRRKKCRNKPTFDMIGEFKCNWLQPVQMEGIMLNITDVKIRSILPKDQEPALAVASVSVEGVLAIHELRLIRRNDGSMFVAMPSIRQATGRWKDVVHPYGHNASEFRKMLTDKVKEAYADALPVKCVEDTLQEE
jgi:DNA-binding cell septation regulator SpoVG